MSFFTPLNPFKESKDKRKHFIYSGTIGYINNLYVPYSRSYSKNITKKLLNYEYRKTLWISPLGLSLQSTEI